MPIFEYRCVACDECFEVLVTRSASEAPRCPQCGAVEVEKRISAFAVGKADSAPGPCGSSDCA